MKEHLTEKFLVGIAADVAVSVNKAVAITFIGAIYGIEITMQLALVVAFCFSALNIKYKSGEDTPSWGEVLNSSIFLCLMPWCFVLTAWLASFVV